MKRLIIILPLLFLACQKPYEKQIKEAYRLYNTGEIEKMEQALEKFNDAVRASINALNGQFEASMALGHKLIQAKFYGKAADAFAQARKLKPDDDAAIYYQALSLANYARAQLGDQRERLFSESEKLYELGLELHPDNSALNYSLGLLQGHYLDKGEEAIERFETVKQLEPYFYESRFMLAKMYFEAGEMNKAKAEYTAILKLSAENSEETYQKAWELRKKIDGEVQP